MALAAGWLLCACSSARPVAVDRVHRMGEPVAVGPLIYTVIDTEWLNQMGEGATARVPQNRFLLLRLSVTNSGASNSGVPGMTLVDASGKTYTELTDGHGVSEWLGYLRTVSPAQTERGHVLFDVPTGAYRLRVTNDAEPGTEKAELIEIPLQLSPSLPNLPGER
jgi:hypothetical protein